MAPTEAKASIFGRGGGQKTHQVHFYYAPAAKHNPAPLHPLTDVAGRGIFPVYWWNHCGSGGTGRRARLRILWPKGRGGSNPSFRTITFTSHGNIGSPALA